MKENWRDEVNKLALSDNQGWFDGTYVQLTLESACEPREKKTDTVELDVPGA